MTTSSYFHWDQNVQYFTCLPWTTHCPTFWNPTTQGGTECTSALRTEQDKIGDFSVCTAANRCTDTFHIGIVHYSTEDIFVVQSKYCALLLILFDQFWCSSRTRWQYRWIGWEDNWSLHYLASPACLHWSELDPTYMDNHYLILCSTLTCADQYATLRIFWVFFRPLHLCPTIPVPSSSIWSRETFLIVRLASLAHSLTHHRHWPGNCSACTQDLSLTNLLGRENIWLKFLENQSRWIGCLLVARANHQFYQTWILAQPNVQQHKLIISYVLPDTL